MRTLAACCVALAAVPLSAAEPAKEMMGLPLAFHEDFAAGAQALRKFEFTDPKAWEIRQDAGRPVLALVAQSKYEPKVRSPLNIAWVKGLKVGPFVMEVELRSTTRDYNHRDLCLFFGGVDPEHFYYVHLGKKPDPNAHNVFIVNARPRRNIATKVDEGTPWTEKYHTARVVRKEGGEIEVYFDGKPAMTAKDDTFPAGRVGVGSFDDTGNFARITVWGRKAGE
ncbi:MAG TPA: hypothetical protein VIL46_11235 [Gemmataceae bacterium]